MTILFKNISDILDKKIDIYQRGILITLLLLKNKDSRITLAGFKATNKIDEKMKQNLILLQDLNFIKWSGYTTASKSISKKIVDPKIIEIITFMNDLYKRNFNYKLESQTKNLRNRLIDNSVEDIKKVITNRYEVWKDDEYMKKYLKPQTLFRPSNFDGYLEEALHTKVGSSLITAFNLNLKDGDEFTSKICEKMLDSDIFTILIYKIDTNGIRKGNGITENRLGKDLKKMLKLQNNWIKIGRVKEFEYIYKK